MYVAIDHTDEHGKPNIPNEILDAAQALHVMLNTEYHIARTGHSDSPIADSARQEVAQIAVAEFEDLLYKLDLCAAKTEEVKSPQLRVV